MAGICGACLSPPTGNHYPQHPSLSPALAGSESDLVKCLVDSGCIGTVKTSYESGPYEITRPTLKATKFARAILALKATAGGVA